MSDHLDLRRALAAAAAFAVIALCASSAHADALNGRISFTSFRFNANGDIFTMNPDGSDQRQLTAAPNHAAQTDWSPDGQDIAFRSRASGTFEVWRMDLYGRGLRQLTASPEQQASSQPTWFPDKSGILFRRSGGGLDAEIWQMGPVGESPALVTALASDQWYPSYSPDMTKVLFATTVVPPSDRGIFVMDTNGTNLRQLTDVPGALDSAPAWSPDGRQVAFESNRDGDTDIYVMNADGTDVRQLTHNTIHDEGPAWSPDGRQLAFTSGPDNLNGDIHVMNADGTNVRRLTFTPGRDESPDWQPIPHRTPLRACGDLVAQGPGAYSVGAGGRISCAKAMSVAARWLLGDAKVKGFACDTRDAGYDARKVDCARRDGSEVVFVARSG